MGLPPSRWSVHSTLNELGLSAVTLGVGGDGGTRKYCHYYDSSNHTSKHYYLHWICWLKNKCKYYFAMNIILFCSREILFISDKVNEYTRIILNSNMISYSPCTVMIWWMESCPWLFATLQEKFPLYSNLRSSIIRSPLDETLWLNLISVSLQIILKYWCSIKSATLSKPYWRNRITHWKTARGGEIEVYT